MLLLAGTTFNHLKACEPVGSGRKWRFRCDCGSEKIVDRSKVVSGHIKSCGCLRKRTLEVLNKGREVPNLTGQRFGRLVVVRKAAKFGPHTYWDCRCDCGAFTYPATSKLRGGYTVSCGCFKADMTGHSRRGVCHPEAGPTEPVLTVERINHLLVFDESINLFRTRFTRGGKRAGEIAGSWGTGDYWTICIDHKKYTAHRLIWFWRHGVWPAELDHSDLDRRCNALANLREATRTLNNANHPCRVDNRVGLKGVFQVKGSSRFYARITCLGRKYHLGGFATAEGASAAYLKKAKELFGDFARAA